MSLFLEDINTVLVVLKARRSLMKKKKKEYIYIYI